MTMTPDCNIDDALLLGGRVCVLVWVVKSPCVPYFCGRVVTVFVRFSVN